MKFCLFPSFLQLVSPDQVHSLGVIGEVVTRELVVGELDPKQVELAVGSQVGEHRQVCRWQCS